MSKMLKTRSGHLVELPTDEEEAAIQRGIAQDPDNPELDDEWFKRARPAKEALPPEVYAGLVAMRKPGQRGPQKAPTKVRVNMRLSPEVVEYFKAGGEGWQTRIDEHLKAFVRKRA
ncbi:MAG: BrnA antitoxin family protein [Pseudomonadota bacterium]